MQLVIQVGFPNGQVTATIDGFDEATAVHNWLSDQGLIPGGRHASNTVDADTTQNANLELQQAQALEQAAAEAAAKTLAKKAAATAKKAAEKPADPPAGPNVSDVTKAVTDYAAKFGPTEARALFARFGVNRGGDLKPEQFVEFIDTARDYIARDIKASDAVMPEGADLM
jgi:sRNA-binding protein